MELTEVKGIGPATAIKLKSAGISTAEDLANASIDDIISAGIRKPTATKIVQNAKDVVGTSSDKIVEEKPKKAPKKTSSKKPEAKEAKREIRDVKIPISYVKGVGPKTRKVLEEAEIRFAKDLSSTTIEKLVELGIGKSTALKILSNAQEQVGSLPSKEKETKPVKKKEEKVATKEVIEEKKQAEKPKKEKKKPVKDVAEHERSPVPQGIPTKKKRGVQVRRVEDVKEEETEQIEKPAGWGVQAKELSEEEIVRRKARQDEIARSRQITRPIPKKLEIVKAIKPKKLPTKGEKPVKLVKDARASKRAKKKVKVAIDYYTHTDIFPQNLESRKRGISGKTGTKKPRITLERDTKLGRISSHRRSRRVIHETQVIVKLEQDFNPDQIVGQKVYFIYPETTNKVPGSISKRFGKSSSGKVLVYFKKGIRTEGINQPIFIK